MRSPSASSNRAEIMDICDSKKNLSVKDKAK